MPDSKQIANEMFDLQNIPGLVEPGNLDPYNRPVYKHADGQGYGTTMSFSFNVPEKGEVLIPQIVNGKLLTQQEAVEHFRKTGEHFGIFDTPANADLFSTDLHNRQDAYMRATHPELYSSK